MYLLIVLEGRYGIVAEEELVVYCSPHVHPEAHSWDAQTALCQLGGLEGGAPSLPWHCRGGSAAVREGLPS